MANRGYVIRLSIIVFRRVFFGWGGEGRVYVFIFRFKICASCLETKAQKNSQSDVCEIAAAGNSMFSQLHSGLGSFLSSSVIQG